jgi:thiosulfate/3-mercaptopyruvate sulfurtransferase
MKEMKVHRTDNIVCYDAMGFFTVSRCAFILRYFGAEHVRILNGGLKKWLAEGRATYAGDYIPG